MMNTNVYFTSSLVLDNHPMKFASRKRKLQYYIVLEYFIKQFEMTEYTDFRLRQYQDFLIENTKKPNFTKSKLDSLISSLLNSNLKPLGRKYRYWIMCDIALILIDEIDIQKAADLVKAYLTQRRKANIDRLLLAFRNEKVTIDFADNLIKQYRKNYEFFKKKELRFIVTANMSAGKSTLINALIGKPIARTSQEVCTGNICYIYNKPFEDDCISLENSKLNMNATMSDITNFEWETKTNIASYFRFFSESKNRVCIIDTPGVNSALNRNHGKITYEALINEKYDKLIYVLNANKLGTDEEISHLKWIFQKVPVDKIIFVINKIDNFKCVDDSIQASIEGVRNDLLEIGYKNSKIYPLSAYFALLTKLKHSGELLTEDEEDEYILYTKKFSKPEYNLSKYYDGIQSDTKDNEYIAMSKKCGLYGLEKILLEE
ncbi:dynamin family protein [Clostridium sp.]|uniref:dynamin family protein n=1 Tax=Clostridium sp. TaxID=1506 RepID=UPI002630A467